MGLTTTDDGRIFLTGISWETYESLLSDYEDQSSVRLAYDSGTLEILRPLFQHERINRALDNIATRIMDEWEWDFINAGSKTFRKESAAKGFEPDTCFYIANVDKIRGKKTVDVAAGDPPPDLLMEIDLTSSSLPRLPIYAALGVPEVWRYAEGRLMILTLSEGEYREQSESAALPKVLAAQVNLWLAGVAVNRRSVWTKSVREWSEKNRPTPNGDLR